MDFLNEGIHILIDPAHMFAEIVRMLILDVVVLGAIWPLVKKWMQRDFQAKIEREHMIIDAEHGVIHHSVIHEEVSKWSIRK